MMCLLLIHLLTKKQGVVAVHYLCLEVLSNTYIESVKTKIEQQKRGL
jgi:phosphoribosylformylglycinamidine (FGAM) synthase PurS component